METIDTTIPEVKLFAPKIFGDTRGFFYESYNEREFAQAVGYVPNFAQDNHSKSSKGVLRGLHYQIKQPQGKLVRVTRGEVFDVAVDMRINSPTFGKWFGTILSEENKRMMWIPKGFAHGFLVLSEHAEFLYKATDFYAPAYERSLLWNDPALAINWPIDKITPLLSKKDQEGCLLKDAEVFTPELLLC